jgi:hypothetical protein
VPLSGGKVFIEHQLLSRFENYLVIESRYRLFTPPFVIDAPPVLDGFYSLPPRCTNRERQAAGGGFFYLYRLRNIYRPVGISA